MYLFLLPRHAALIRAHEIAQGAPVTAELLAETFDRLRNGGSPLRAAS
jgi:hypothetical protein